MTTLRLPYQVRLCGDFAMLSHFISISGGYSRGPSKWPCRPTSFLSLLAHTSAGGAAHQHDILADQWELAVWILRTGKSTRALLFSHWR